MPASAFEPAGRAEGLVEHDDRDARAVVARALQRVGAAQRDALRDHRIGRGGLGELGARDGGRAAHGRERARPQRGLEPAAHPALRDAARRDDRPLRPGAVSRRCHKDRSGDGRLGERSAGALAMSAERDEPQTRMATGISCQFGASRAVADIAHEGHRSEAHKVLSAGAHGGRPWV